jgi:hypothetical protein
MKNVGSVGLIFALALSWGYVDGARANKVVVRRRLIRLIGQRLARRQVRRRMAAVRER